MQTIIYQQFQRHIKAGDKASAQKLISQYLKDNPNDADGWYLAATVAGKEQRVNLLNKALAVDPFHEKSHQALVRLQVESTPYLSPSRSNWVVIILLVGFGIITVFLVQNYLTHTNLSVIADDELGSHNNPYFYDGKNGYMYGQLPDQDMGVIGMVRELDNMPLIDANEEWVLIALMSSCRKTMGTCSYSMRDFQLVDKNGNTYDVQILEDDPRRYIFPSEISSGETVSGFLGFIIPKSLSISELLFIYNSRYFEVPPEMICWRC